MTCQLENIVAIYLLPVRHEVNHRGEAIARLGADDSIFDHYKCDKHDCTFRRWRAVLAHIGQPATQSADEILGQTPCRFCGCTDDAECKGGCHWASEEQIRAAGLEPNDGDVCSRCIKLQSLKYQPGVVWWVGHSDLETALTNIVHKATKAYNGADVPPLIAEMKQAFTDANWRRIPTEPEIQSGLKDGSIQELMTGQEWYDRFYKELPQPQTVDNYMLSLEDINEAAKKAAGIES